MSRNFELLQRLEEDQAEKRAADAIFATPEKPAFSEIDVPIEGQILPPLQDMVSGEIRKLIERLFVSTASHRAVVFSGVERHTGCSWLAAHMAQNLAMQGRGSVCLIDGNLRFPALHNVFRVENHHGLTDAVLDSQPMRNFIRRLPIPNLWLLSCGSWDKTASALLEPEALRRRILELRNEFDFVIVDSAALNVHADAIALGTACEGLALVLKANSSRKETARRIMQEVHAAKVPLFGAVLNQRTFPIPQAIYSRL